MDFTNPVLNADWPDPDVVRAGDDYYLVCSSFNRAPGLPVLHSRDLVSWEIVARALLLGGVGLIDPCPFWDDGEDDTGRAYLVHGWARSRSGIANRLTLVEVDPDLTTVTGPPRTVIDGDELPGYHTLEGPKMYRRDGPYEGRVVLAQGDTPVNGPHQGAWVDTPAGEHWFPHFSEPERGDDFTSTSLDPRWHWQANPAPDWLELPHVVCRRSTDGRQEVTLAQESVPDGLRASCDAEGVITFAWRTRSEWREAVATFPATAGRWIGADVGLFASARLGMPVGVDHVAFDEVSVDLAGAEEVAA